MRAKVDSTPYSCHYSKWVSTNFWNKERKCYTVVYFLQVEQNMLKNLEKFKDTYGIGDVVIVW